MKNLVVLIVYLFLIIFAVGRRGTLHGQRPENGSINETKLIVSFDTACSLQLDAKIELLEELFPCIRKRGLKKKLINTEYIILDIIDNNGSCLNQSQINYNDYCITSIDFEPIFNHTSLSCEKYNLNNGPAGYSWSLDKLDKVTDYFYTYLNNGGQDPGVDIYILDSGVQINHMEFLTGQVTNMDSAFPNITYFHGTHVAGSAGGQYYGVSRNVKIYSYNVCRYSDGSCAFEDIFNGLEAVYYKLQGSGRRGVINLSLGGSSTTGIDTLFDEYFQDIISVGGIAVAAAGNSNTDACTFAPAKSSYAIAVGSFGSSGVKSSFSNYGSCVDIWGPGENIVSSYWVSDNVTDEYAIASGTSMATPHITGIIVNYLTANSTLNFSQIVTKLNSNSFNVSSCGSGYTCRGAYYTCENSNYSYTPTPTSSRPTKRPTSLPTTSTPTPRPSSKNPTNRPSLRPTPRPTSRPTSHPTPRPTSRPTSHPTLRPTSRPTSHPTSRPTRLT